MPPGATRVLIEVASEQTVTMEAFMDGESVCVVTKVSTQKHAAAAAGAAEVSSWVTGRTNRVLFCRSVPAGLKSLTMPPLSFVFEGEPLHAGSRGRCMSHDSCCSCYASPSSVAPGA